MPQLKIPCMLMRGGTSKGPFFDLRDLPSYEEQRSKLLLRLMGSPDVSQIDGLGGAKTVTSKVVMVRPSSRTGIDVDFLFAQVEIENSIVDTGPTCGNMMTGVAPFAIERRMVISEHPETKVRIYNINTDSTSEAIVQTPKGIVQYDGETTIDGVPGTAAPIQMNLFDQHGVKTGKLFPSGKTREQIGGVEVSLVDSCTALMLLKAEDIGLSGEEGKEFFLQNPDVMKSYPICDWKQASEWGWEMLKIVCYRELVSYLRHSAAAR
ncbi:MAG: PrpF domain-containing protein [Calditrichia bacterium]